MAGEGLAASTLTEIALPLALAVIMFGMGLALTREDFTRIRRQPKAVAIGLFAQVLVLPVLAMGVGVLFHHAFGLSPILVLGILLLGACPGGTTSNLVTYLARADAALSVTVTSVNTLASVVTTPLVFLAMTTIVFGQGSVIQVDILEMMILVLAMVVVPVALGMQAARWKPALAKRAEKPFKVVSSIFLVLIIAGVILENRADFWTLAARSVPAALVLNLAALAAGLLAGRWAGLSEYQSRAISIEVGFQNGTLGIALALSQLGSGEAAIVPGFYSLVMFLTGGLVAWWWAKRPAHPPLAPEPVRRVEVEA